MKFQLKSSGQAIVKYVYSLFNGKLKKSSLTIHVRTKYWNAGRCIKYFSRKIVKYIQIVLQDIEEELEENIS